MRRAALGVATLGVAALALAGCSEPPEPTYQEQPYYRPAPLPTSQGWPTQPQEALPSELPTAPAETPAWTEPPLNPVAPAAPDANPSQSPGAPATGSGAPASGPSAPAASTPSNPAAGNPPNAAARFNALKSNLEQGGGSDDSGGTTGCTNVHQRTGFHDHYGALNSSGDVLQTCAPPAK